MSTVSATVLRKLHHIHSQMAEVKGRLERGPKQILAHKANVAKLNLDLDAAKLQVKDATRAADTKQLDIRDSDVKLEKWNEHLNSASSNHEFKTLQVQIEAGKMAASVLEDETLELLTRIDDFKAQVERAESNLQAGKNELEKVKNNVETSSETLQSEVVRLGTELAESEKDLAGDLKEDYKRVVRSKGADGLSPVDEGVCQGCGNKMTLNMQANLVLSKPVFCPACGCFLYQAD